MVAARQRMRLDSALVIKQHVDAFGRRGPEPERGAFRREGRTERRRRGRVSAHTAPAKANTERGAALNVVPEATASTACVSVVFST